MGVEGVHCSSPLLYLLTVLLVAGQLLGLIWLELGLLVSVLYHFLKSPLPLLHQFLHLDHWLSLFHALPSDVAVTGREPSLFLNPTAADWTTLKSQNAYCPVSC